MLEWGSGFQNFLGSMVLALALALLSAYFLYFRKGQRQRFLIKDQDFLSYFRESSPLNLHKLLHFFSLALFAVGMIFLIIAFARPQKRNETINQTSEGINIMMVLDISDSMLIEDMEPTNRLESAKLRIKEFIEKRISDRIGLLVFSGQSYTRVPLTLDYDLLLESLQMVQTSERIRKGTAIGVALANAIGRLEKNKDQTNIVILLTDGENNIGAIDPITAMEIAKDAGIKVYTVGIGKDGLAQLPVLRKFPNGMVQKYYRPMHSAVNEKLLNQIAKETGGKFYRVIDSTSLNDVFSEINELEKTEVEIQKISMIAELYSPWNFWGLILLLSSQFIYLVMVWRIF